MQLMFVWLSGDTVKRNAVSQVSERGVSQEQWSTKGTNLLRRKTIGNHSTQRVHILKACLVFTFMRQLSFINPFHMRTDGLCGVGLGEQWSFRHRYQKLVGV